MGPDLRESPAKSDKLKADLLERIDNYIEKKGFDVPRETLPELQDGNDAEVLTELDIQAAGITSVILATSYRFDFGLVRLRILDGDGYPTHKRGITD